jgi:glycosyltransferase involved in cell wall biosynthesis
MRVLVATTVLPVAPAGGGEVATRGFADALRAAGHEVEVLGYQRPADPPPDDDALRAVGRRPIESAAAPRATRAAWAARALLSRRGFSEAKYVSGAYRRALRAAAAGPQPDLVVIDHAQMAWLVGAVRAPLVHIAHNAEHRLYREAARDTTGPRRLVAAREARRLSAAEQRLARAAREVWTLTTDDARAHAALGATTRAFAFAGAPPPAQPAAARRPGSVALLGTWTWGPNRAGLEWFLDDVLPRLPDGLEVLVAGRGAEAVAGTRARAVGFVSDASAFLAAAGAVAVPAVAGGGLQIKTLDAIATGAPVVATPLALRGIEHPPPSVRVAGDAEAFAAALAAAAAGAADPQVGREWARRRAERFGREVAEAALAVSAAGARAARPAPRVAAGPRP